MESSRWSRWVTIAAVLLLAGIAAVVSYSHMYELAPRHGEPEWRAALDATDPRVNRLARGQRRGRRPHDVVAAAGWPARHPPVQFRRERTRRHSRPGHLLPDQRG
ncbi:DUF2637 domain-containing protein [Nocardiopsis aegyptia]|uniref:DUF2637 domain-containing protein n=1 Tax=Nocardiopsis aegyptia TaxID=220378 RepID=UPI0035E43741